ncbi:unnamed protein product, partial [Musa acuminata subsp. malaccensis]
MADKVAKLKTLGMDVDEYFLVQFILNSLPSQFGPFKIHYNTNKDKWDLNELTSMLISMGTYRLRLETGHLMDLVDTCYVPTISRNLISLSRIDELGYYISFGSGKLSIFYDSIKVGSGILYDVVDTLEVYINEVKRRLDRKVKIVRSDRGESDYDIGIKRDPLSFSQAIESNDSEKWYDAMKEELKSMVQNDVWDLVELPNDCKRVGCKWVFKTKCDSTSNIERYKARLVAKGFSQKEGIDYNETFSPVSKKDSLRIVMALVAHYDLELHQMDVKTTFLNGDLDEEIYMEQPEGFIEKGKE